MMEPAATKVGRDHRLLDVAKARRFHIAANN